MNKLPKASSASVVGEFSLSPVRSPPRCVGNYRPICLFAFGVLKRQNSPLQSPFPSQNSLAWQPQAQTLTLALARGRHVRQVAPASPPGEGGRPAGPSRCRRRAAGRGGGGLSSARRRAESLRSPRRRRRRRRRRQGACLLVPDDHLAWVLSFPVPDDHLAWILSLLG